MEANWPRRSRKRWLGPAVGDTTQRVLNSPGPSRGGTASLRLRSTPTVGRQTVDAMSAIRRQRTRAGPSRYFGGGIVLPRLDGIPFVP